MTRRTNDLSVIRLIYYYFGKDFNNQFQKLKSTKNCKFYLRYNNPKMYNIKALIISNKKIFASVPSRAYFSVGCNLILQRLNSKALTLETNQEELKRLRDIILATVDYSLQKSANTMKIDGQIPWESRYKKLKQNAEKDFKQNKLEKLKRTLSNVLEDPLARVDLSFNTYIQEKTGHEINIFQNIQERVDKIIKLNKIKNEKEFHDAACMISKLRQESSDENKMNVLHNLCRDFNKLRTKINSKDDFILKELSHIKSPNEKFKLIVYENERNGEFGTTTVSVSGKNAGASLYDAEGVNLNIRAYWKDDNTIIIESRKANKVLSRHKQIQFSNDIIEINLIEN